ANDDQVSFEVDLAVEKHRDARVLEVPQELDVVDMPIGIHVRPAQSAPPLVSGHANDLPGSSIGPGSGPARKPSTTTAHSRKPPPVVRAGLRLLACPPVSDALTTDEAVFAGYPTAWERVRQLDREAAEAFGCEEMGRSKL